ncbi:MAG TPA: tetratricopeptide repeat protein, partial [Bacteroidales bacterium]|nr:tetratricopeptide repeat protein [Bacteroidales bacterium]
MNIKQILLIPLIALILSPVFLWSQESHLPLPKARKAFNKALDYWEGNDLAKAEAELRKAIEIDSLFLDAYLLLADIHFDRSDLEETVNLYSRAISIDPMCPPKVYYLLGSACLANDDFDGAIRHFNVYLSREDIPDERKALAREKKATAIFRRAAYENPVPFQPVNLGPGINSQFDEYVNSITLDESKMVFTLTQPDTLNKGRLTEGFVMAVREDSGWVRAGRALPDLYELGNIGAMSLSPDGQFLFFTSCGSPRGYGSCDLFVCARDGDDWTDPQNLGDVVNTANWDSQPCFSADGQTLYFSSARRGGMGGSDIWFTRFRQGAGWTKPENAGPMINTAKEEMAP